MSLLISLSQISVKAWVQFTKIDKSELIQNLIKDVKGEDIIRAAF